MNAHTRAHTHTHWLCHCRLNELAIHHKELISLSPSLIPLLSEHDGDSGDGDDGEDDDVIMLV